MGTGRSQFVGAAGQYFVAYGLTIRQINAGLTLGNAPSVDLLAASADGRGSLSIQVKTSRNAYRRRRYGHEGYEWDVGASVIGKHAESFVYAMVDLQESEDGWTPRVFFVPSKWIAEFVQPDWGRKMYFLPVTAQELTLERWDLIAGYLNGEKHARKWASSWPQELLVQW